MVCDGDGDGKGSNVLRGARTGEEKEQKEITLGHAAKEAPA
jgi:hypothetical protein